MVCRFKSYTPYKIVISNFHFLWCVDKLQLYTQKKTYIAYRILVVSKLSGHQSTVVVTELLLVTYLLMIDTRNRDLSSLLSSTIW